MKKYEKLKICSNELIFFHHFSQAMSNCWFLRALLSLREREKDENAQNMVKRAEFFIIFQGLSQTAAF